MNLEKLTKEEVHYLWIDFLLTYYVDNDIMGEIEDPLWLERTKDLNIPDSMSVDDFNDALADHIHEGEIDD